MTFNLGRRLAFRRVFLGSALGLMFAIGVSYPRRAEAFVWEIPKAVIEFYDVTVTYYEEYIEKYVDKAREIADLFGDDNPLIPSILTATDSANYVRAEIEQSRAKRESEAPPSDQCAAENVDKAAETMSSISDHFGSERAKANLSELELIFKENRGFDSQRNIENEINEKIESISLIDALESIDAGSFVGNEGYLEPAKMNNFILTLMAKAKVQMSLAVTRDYQGIADGATYISRLSAAEDALTRIYHRRLPSMQFYEDVFNNGLPYERDIVDRIKRPLGMSVVDQERFEIERTHLSKVWQDALENNTSATSVSKEINFVQAFSNALDVRINEFEDILSTLKGVTAITELDTTSKKDHDALMEEFGEL